MRLNRFIATYTDFSRRKADDLIDQGKVVVNRKTAHQGMDISDSDTVFVGGELIVPVKKEPSTVLLHKPVGYVCSKDGQGSPTVYELLQPSMQNLHIAGRLDKDSSGLVVLTDDGMLMQELTHPSNDKEKVYVVKLNKPLEDGMIAKLAKGVDISDTRLSKLMVTPLTDPDTYEVSIQEGRNRQIRRSFEAIGYGVHKLHRIQLGPYKIEPLAQKQFKIL
jgi:23S rRNA pseudouridine2605 synthase